MQLRKVRTLTCRSLTSDATEGYKTLVEGTPVSIHPSSALFQRPPEWCIYYELVLTASKHRVHFIY